MDTITFSIVPTDRGHGATLRFFVDEEIEVFNVPSQEVRRCLPSQLNPEHDWLCHEGQRYKVVGVDRKEVLHADA